MTRLLVVGGSGFIGRELCRRAVAAGHEVRSVSRGGRPTDVDPAPAAAVNRAADVDAAADADPATDGDADPPADWVEAVEWTSADLFAPHAWRDRLRGVDAVVHSVGIAHEEPTAGATFERLNGDSAILTALEAERAGVDAFVFLSSAVRYPTARAAYLQSKRRAEQAIGGLALETTVLRPGPVYGPGQPHFPRSLNALCRLVDRVPALATRLGEVRPLSVGRVADATLAAALEPTNRLLTVDDIARA